MIQKKLLKILAGYGLHTHRLRREKNSIRIFMRSCAGRSATREPDTILNEIGKGYQLKSKVIRPSKVVIAEHVGEQ